MLRFRTDRGILQVSPGHCVRVNICKHAPDHQLTPKSCANVCLCENNFVYENAFLGVYMCTCAKMHVRAAFFWAKIRAGLVHEQTCIRQTYICYNMYMYTITWEYSDSPKYANIDIKCNSRQATADTVDVCMNLYVCTHSVCVCLYVFPSILYV